MKRKFKLIRGLLFVLAGLVVFFSGYLVNEYISSLDQVMGQISQPCNAKEFTSEEFRKECLGIKPGTNIVDAIILLGSPTHITKNKNGIWEVQIFGGRDMFCDSCILEFNSTDYKIIKTYLIFGDQ